MAAGAIFRGFSLIELLVVVSIIAVLVSMLLPAIGLVRAHARTTVCASQLGQIGVASFAYATDNDSTFPPAFANPNTYKWLVNYSGEDNGIGALVPDYLDEGRIIVCPGMNLSNGGSAFPSANAYAARYAGYRYNGNPWEDIPSSSLNVFRQRGVRFNIGGGWPIGPSTFKGSTWAGPARTVLAFDMLSENTGSNAVYHPHPGDLVARAAGPFPLVSGANVLFADGHVVWLIASNWRREGGTMTNGAYYCPSTGY